MSQLGNISFLSIVAPDTTIPTVEYGNATVDGICVALSHASFTGRLTVGEIVKANIRPIGPNRSSVGRKIVIK